MVLVFAGILFVLSACYLYEKNRLDFYRASFKAVIHVNGIRGKTSTCRILDASLRGKYKVFTKTTGTDAAFINVEGKEQPVKRFGPANIHEQIRMVRKAYREHADILILECMAVRPDLQMVSQNQILQSSISVITNVRYDHPFEMGTTLDEIAESLSACIPENGTLYTADLNYADFFRQKCVEKNSTMVLCLPGPGEWENIAIAREISYTLGISAEEFSKSRSGVQEDFGVSHLYHTKNSSGETIDFVNLFSVNDPQSSRIHVKKLEEKYSSVYFLYNNRYDRPDRMLLFSLFFFPYVGADAIYVMGSSRRLAKKCFPNLWTVL